MAYVTERQSALPDAKRDPEMGHLNFPWPTYGGSANYTMGLSGTVWHTWERACLKRAKFFFAIFFDHVIKPMVWGHNGYMGHTGTYFCFP